MVYEVMGAAAVHEATAWRGQVTSPARWSRGRPALEVEGLYTETLTYMHSLHTYINEETQIDRSYMFINNTCTHTDIHPVYELEGI